MTNRNSALVMAVSLRTHRNAADDSISLLDLIINDSVKNWQCQAGSVQGYEYWVGPIVFHRSRNFEPSHRILPLSWNFPVSTEFHRTVLSCRKSLLFGKTVDVKEHRTNVFTHLSSYTKLHAWQSMTHWEGVGRVCVPGESTVSVSIDPTLCSFTGTNHQHKNVETMGYAEPKATGTPTSIIRGS